jgi:hypothetical protein
MVAHTPLGQILAEEGRTQNWLAIQVSARLGRPVLRQEIGRWVNGIHTPQPAAQAAVADALGRSMLDVFPIKPGEVAA